MAPRARSGPELTDHAGLSPERLAALGGTVGEHTTLERMLRWGAAQEPLRRVDEIVTQDEFTHDVLVAVDPPLWLAYDVT